MTQEQRFEEMGPDEIPGRAEGLKAEGYRMVQICAIAMDSATELIYSFDRDHSLLNLKAVVPFGMGVRSITPTYWAAFVYENEIHDLFGVEFEDSKLDYKGNFFRTGTETPWKRPDVKEGARWARGR